MKQTVKERTIVFVDYKGITMKRFEERCGLSSGYVTSMRKSFGAEKLNNVLTAFPELNRDWLLYGEGNMIKGEEPEEDSEIIRATPDHSGVPVYDIDATCGKDPRDFNLVDEAIIGSVNLPNVRRDSMIIRANGDSMTPVIHDGNWIAVREIYNFNDVFYGQMYLIITEEYRMIKYVRRYEPDEDNYVILRSENPNYDDIKMKKSHILKVFIVENILAVKIQM